MIAVFTCVFPVTSLDVRFIVNSYLDKWREKVKYYKKNITRKEWLTLILVRHKNVLANRITLNISISRGAVRHEAANNFFNNLKQELEYVDHRICGIMMKQIWSMIMGIKNFYKTRRKVSGG